MAKFWSDDFPEKSSAAPCYLTHPALKIGEWLVYGSSAANPTVKDADIYVSLQDGSRSGYATYPWETGDTIEVAFPIPDTKPPSHKQTASFIEMVEWLCNQLQSGKKIHIGCIGGHGRTGMLLSAMVAKMGTKDAIRYVRENYCKKAVESDEQVKFLIKHFDVTPVTGSKEELWKSAPKEKSWEGHKSGFSSTGHSYGAGHSISSGKKHDPAFKGGSSKQSGFWDSGASTSTYRPVGSGRNLWKKRNK